MSDRLSALKIFQAVASHGSFAAAAEVLQTSPASVTRALQQLERWLDTRLVLRTTRSIEITATGKRLLQESEEILGRIEYLEESLSGERQALAGELRVSLPVGLSPYLFSRLSQFIERYPLLKLKLDFDDRRVDLFNDAYDIALRVANLPDAGIFARKLCDFHDIVVASPAYIKQHGEPTSIAELQQHRCIMDTNHARHDHLPFVVNGEITHVPIKGSVILSQANAVVDAACTGLGIAVLPEFFVREAIQSGSLIQILADIPGESYPLSALFTDREYIPQKTRVFIDFLVEIFSVDD